MSPIIKPQSKKDQFKLFADRVAHLYEQEKNLLKPNESKSDTDPLVRKTSK